MEGLPGMSFRQQNSQDQDTVPGDPPICLPPWIENVGVTAPFCDTGVCNEQGV